MGYLVMIPHMNSSCNVYPRLNISFSSVEQEYSLFFPIEVLNYTVCYSYL